MVAAQIATSMGGNPLARIDLARDLSVQDLTGSNLADEPIPAGRPVSCGVPWAATRSTWSTAPTWPGGCSARADRADGDCDGRCRLGGVQASTLAALAVRELAEGRYRDAYESLFQALRNPANRHKAVGFTPEKLHYTFTNILGEEESRAV
jgi:hypothetical protein